MSIIRIVKDKDFFVASNVPFNDKNLSWEARGMMGYFLSKPDDWQVMFGNLVKAGTAKDFKVRKVLKELEEHGYLERKRIANDKGQYEWVSTIFEVPAILRKSTRGKPARGKSIDGKPQDIISTESLNTNTPNTESSSSPLAPATPGEKILFELLAKEAKAKGRRSPKRFPTLVCKEEFNKAEERLGKNLNAAIRTALKNGIASIPKITAYISKFNPKKGKSSFEERMKR